MIKRLLHILFATTAILSWSFSAYANCPDVVNGIITLLPGETYNCDANIIKTVKKIEGNGSISINENITITTALEIGANINITFKGTVSLTGGSITNNGIIELKNDYKQTGGTLSNNGSINGKNISFEVSNEKLNLNSGSNIVINNKNMQSEKFITITGNIGNGINFNEGSLFAVHGNDVKLFSNTSSRQTINGQILILDGDLYYNPKSNNESLTISSKGKLVVLDSETPYDKGFIHFAPVNNKNKLNIYGEIYATGFKGNPDNGGQSTLEICPLGPILGQTGKVFLTDATDTEKLPINCTPLINWGLGPAIAKNTLDANNTTLSTDRNDLNKSSCDCTPLKDYGCAIHCLQADVPFPVSLTEFIAKIIDNAVLVNWKTASETNNDFFTLLRSQNGTQFNEIARITGMGNTTEVQQYEYIDTNPLAGLSYYRLSQTDFDGTTTLHNIVPVFYNTIPESFSAFTYRLNGIASLQLQFATSESTNTARVYSIMGELQFEETIVAGISAYTIDAPLQAGVYIVTNTCNNITSSIKVLIQ